MVLASRGIRSGPGGAALPAAAQQNEPRLRSGTHPHPGRFRRPRAGAGLPWGYVLLCSARGFAGKTAGVRQYSDPAVPVAVAFVGVRGYDVLTAGPMAGRLVGWRSVWRQFVPGADLPCSADGRVPDASVSGPVHRVGIWIVGVGEAAGKAGREGSVLGSDDNRGVLRVCGSLPKLC